MRYVSVFSGIEAASAAWEPLGWEPMAFSEVDPFCCALLEKRYPGVPNLGDIKEVDWNAWRRKNGKPDLLVGGSPCQSFSVAGRREGLEGASGLMWEYVRAVRELVPRWVLWENVPGALSSTHGEDFRCLLESLDGLGYGLAWRVLDAQFFGVAQRRRRLFVVGHLGDVRAADVLFEPEGLRWDHPAGREKRQELAAAAGRGSEGEGGCLTPWDCQAKRVFSPDGCAPSLSAGSGEGMNIQPTVITQYGDEVAGTLTARFDSSPCPDRGQNVLAYGFSYKASAGSGTVGFDREVGPSLLAGRNDAAVCYVFAQNTRDEVRLVGGDGSVAGALAASPGMKQQTYVMESTQANAAVDRGVSGCVTAHSAKDAPVLSDGCVVRRLTPLECERLQGFPDGWTDIEAGGKPAKDAPRYRALGNSMAVPVMRWIGERIDAADAAGKREEMTDVKPLAGVPQVRVLDEEGREVLRGWYVFHEGRQPAAWHDELRPEDVAHCVAVDSFADWNMPRRLKLKEITPPHRIEVVGGCDRDALLRLADEIMAKSKDIPRDPDPMKPLASSLDLFGYARRIRDACGAKVVEP